MTAVTAATARSNAAPVASEGFWTPLTLRTYWRARGLDLLVGGNGLQAAQSRDVRHMTATVVDRLRAAPQPAATDEDPAAADQHRQRQAQQHDGERLALPGRLYLRERLEGGIR